MIRLVKESPMAPSNRREFLSDVGRGMVALQACQLQVREGVRAPRVESLRGGVPGQCELRLAVAVGDVAQVVAQASALQVARLIELVPPRQLVFLGLPPLEILEEFLSF